MAILISLIFAASVGCSDHRIGLRQFMDMQQTPPPTAKATAEPADLAAAEQMASKINETLGAYKVGSGDVLGVTVLGAEGNVLFPPLQIRVDRQGEVDLPLAGRLKVEGMEFQDIERAVKAKFVPSLAKSAVAHITMVAAQTTGVLVVGAVTTSGMVELRRSERNMLFAIVAAGGVTDMASGRATLRRIRRPSEEVTLNLTDPQELSVALSLDPLESGDIVYVEAAEPSIVYVGGLVNRPAPQSYPPGTQRNILQALAAAGGLRTDVSPMQGTLIRRMPGGGDVYVKLNLNSLAKGKDPNIALAAGDILWVPETAGTRVQDWVNRNIFFRAGATVTYNVTGVEYLNRRNQQTSGGRRGGLEDQFDPFGFLNRAALLQNINTQTTP